MIKRYSISFVILLVFSHVSFAQGTETKGNTKPSYFGINWVNGKNPETFDTKRWIVGIQTGILSFHGDLTQQKGNVYRGFFNDGKFTPNFGLVAKYSFSHVLGFRMTYFKGSFELDNGGRYYGEYFFNILNKINSVEGQLYVNLGNLSFLRHDRKLHMDLFMGVGTVFTNISGTLTAYHNWMPSINLKTDPYWSTKTKSHYATIPIGIGLMYNLNNHFDIGVEAGLRYVRTDSLDFANSEEHRNRTFDKFSQTTLGLYYKFGSKKPGHYDWIDPLASMYDGMADMKAKVDSLVHDADNDGVADYFDKEPNTPAGAKVTGAGQALDSDGDGIPDYKDQEPFSDKNQPVDADGKMFDDDGDGVPNGRDLEPATAKGNLVNFQGKTIPVYTYNNPPANNNQPNNNQPNNNQPNNNAAGNTEPTATRRTENVSSSGKHLPIVFFDTDKWLVKPDYYMELQEVAEIMKANPDLKLDIVGNADYRLDDAHNDMLGDNRAKAVIEILVKGFGIDKGRLNLKNNGERVPMIDGKGPAFDPYNRRVQIFVAGTNSNIVK